MGELKEKMEGKELQIDLEERYKADLTFQDYSAPKNIEGVFTITLKKHLALEGWFMELIRITDGIIERLPEEIKFEPRQISLSYAVPHRINAFHVHPRKIQDELWCVLKGRLKVWLVDIRKGSPTLGIKRDFILDESIPTLLYIPSGVAHGYKAGHKGALFMYIMNSQFNPENPNEGRLPWDYFGKDLWEEDLG